MHLSRVLFFAVCLLLAAPGYGAGKSKFGVSVEPVVGYEREVKLVPTMHTVERFFYGARLIAGYPLLSAEAEYTRANDTEEFPTQNLTIKDQTDKLKVGVRSTPSIGKILFLSLRAGVQASRNNHQEILNNVSTVTDQPLEYDPYAGAGLRLVLGKKMSLAFDFTGVLRDTADLSSFTPQASAGVSIRFP